MPRPKLPPSQLTDREQEVRACVEQGMSNSQIAAQLGISPKTVESHMGQIYEKEEAPLSGSGPARRIEFLARLIRGQ